jgi:hypothetical protein
MNLHYRTVSFLLLNHLFMLLRRSDVSSRVDEVRLLGEALCHSQTRARRAEEAKAAVSVENDRLRQLLLLEVRAYLFFEIFQKSFRNRGSQGIGNNPCITGGL